MISGVRIKLALLIVMVFIRFWTLSIPEQSKYRKFEPIVKMYFNIEP